MLPNEKNIIGYITVNNMTAKELIHYLLNFDMNSEVTFIDENNVENHITSCSRDYLGMGKFIIFTIITYD